MYTRGVEYPPRREPLTGPELLALAAEGDTEAMLILADLTDDYATEKAWIKKAAEAGNVDAIRKLDARTSEL